ncbi:2'-5' RNA ligase family protein [Microbispora sp. RL4-1S]|uniref:2'-5' RNA ligase family protein n=1 Tax=Microbispora oryzae TaxID=2806554 RepID=A0A940WR57_9ACTN|nr:2'-5' RNA ligase family protein [Microbispora oryzae]MBP2705975.1 2'-5' RNA ligase family protein [Microbispora oryzae]
MSPLPQFMADRWGRREMLPRGKGRIYWHVLFRDHPQVQAMVSEAHRRLAGVEGLDPVPYEWLHLTTLVVGLTDEITQEQLTALIGEARKHLAEVRPITVTFGRVLYHPEAIAVEARPVAVLAPMLDAVRAATRAATGRDGELGADPWIPHVTVAYSSAEQPAAPVIAALGRHLPDCEVTIRGISLVLQDGPEYLWAWRPRAEVPLGTPADGNGL